MDAFKDHELAINWKLMKQCRYHHIMFNSYSTEIIKWNYYQISLMIATAIFIGSLLFGNVGHLTNVDVTFTFEEYVLTFYENLHFVLMLYKLSIMIYRVNKFRDVFDVSQIKFLESVQCVKNWIMLKVHQDETIKKINIYFMINFIAIGLWMIQPIIIEIFLPRDTNNERIQNILNYPFPFTTSSYNKYYVIFFGIEAFICVFFVYGLFLVDLLLLSFGWVIIAQYRVIHRAFADIGHQYDSGMFALRVILRIKIITHSKRKNETIGSLY